ncbi:MAG: hypothetical protein SGI77_02915 [Pirellulaceae bacterium]|nr:hypothetical protein [Pirellulaceae bacterium]
MPSNKKTTTSLSKLSKSQSDSLKLLAQVTESEQPGLDELKRSVLRLHNAITNCVGFVALGFYQAGRQLRAVRNLKPHGQFSQWVETECKESFSLRTAQRYMAFSEFVDRNIATLRGDLKESLPSLEIDELSDEEVLRRLPSSRIFSIMAEKKATTKDLPNSINASDILSRDFKASIANFLGTPDLILTSIHLGINEIDTPEIVTGNKATIGRTLWPFTVLSIIGPTARAESWIDDLFDAAERNEVREALILLPTQKLHESNNKNLLELPQLLFANTHPLLPSAGKASKLGMSLLLLSDTDRLPDFASAFTEFGIVKIPYTID